MRAFEGFYRRYSYQLASGLSQLIGIWLIYVYSNFVDVEEFALFVVINVINGGVTVLLSLGYNPYFVRKMSLPNAVKRDELNEYVTFSAASGLAAVALSSLALVVVEPGHSSLEICLIASSYWLCTYFMTTFNFILNALHRFAEIGYWQLLHVVCKAVLFLMCYKYCTLSLVVSHSAGSAVLALLLGVYYRRQLMSLRLRRPRLREVWTESRFLYLESYANYFSKELDAVLVTLLATQRFLVSFYILQRVQKVFIVVYTTFEKEDLSLALKGQSSVRRKERLVILASVTLLGVVCSVIFLPKFFNKLDPDMAPFISLMLFGLLLSYFTYSRARIDAFVNVGAKKRLIVTLWYLITGYGLLGLLFPFFGQYGLFGFHLAGSVGILGYLVFAGKSSTLFKGLS